MGKKMNYKEYIHKIEKTCGYKYGLMNKKVYVTGMSFKKSYECTYHQYGVISIQVINALELNLIIIRTQQVKKDCFGWNMIILKL